MLTTHVILSIIPALDKHLVIANTLFYLLAAKGFFLTFNTRSNCKSSCFISFKLSLTNNPDIPAYFTFN